ncbi:MAG: hypothetical protein IOC82_01340 [Aestuariivirga sp.]|uniref:hypothetical protein n=1 Tax=Aestuariivirga sp. TaxID=2650926 RepID=UPI0025BC4307|nr:hypothetical protein [Aestuariivirga sp.]MCA3559656.1 hypothetical protein [Aestuariivirga sp.]
MLLDQRIRIAGLFYEDHVCGIVEDDDLGARQVLGVGAPPVAPAIANAYDALSGTRERNLPLGS